MVADFMEEVLEDITVVDGAEEAVTGEDVAFTPITRTGDMLILTTVITPITHTGIGQLSVIRTEGVTESGCCIIEGERCFLKRSISPCLRIMNITHGTSAGYKLRCRHV